MCWLFLDETNNSANEGTFIICGGLSVPSDRLVDVHKMIERVRLEYGFANSDQFKFQTSSRPKTMDVEKWTNAKRAALEQASEMGIDMQGLGEDAGL